MFALKTILWVALLLTFFGADFNEQGGYLAVFLGSAAILGAIYVKEAK